MTDIYHRPPLFKQLNAALAMMSLPDMSWVLMMLRDYLLKSTVFQWANIEHALRGTNKIHGATPILFLIPNSLNKVNFPTNFCPSSSQLDLCWLIYAPFRASDVQPRNSQWFDLPYFFSYLNCYEPMVSMRN